MIPALKLVPAWVWVVLAVAASFGVMWVQLHSAHTALDQVTTERDTATARVTSLTNTIRLQRELTEDINRVSDDAKAKADHVTAAVAIADGRASSLQQQITDLLDRGEQCSAEVTSGSKARAGLTVLLADLRRSADETAGRLAEALDRSRIAGFACEAAYAAALKSK